MFKKSVLMGMLALAFVTLAAREVRAWDLLPGDPLYGCLDGFCSYEGHVDVRAVKGSSVNANAVTVAMQQVVPPGHAVGFCANPKGKIQKGQAFSVNVTAFQGLGPNSNCTTKGKCSVVVHQVVSTSDLPAVCNNNCPAACTNGQSASDCLVTLFGLDPNTVCQPSQGSTTNNNFSLAAIVWDTVDVTFFVIDSTSTINPVATLTATCTSSAGLSLNQGVFNCVVQ